LESAIKLAETLNEEGVLSAEKKARAVAKIYGEKLREKK